MVAFWFRRLLKQSQSPFEVVRKRPNGHRDLLLPANLLLLRMNSLQVRLAPISVLSLPPEDISLAMSLHTLWTPPSEHIQASSDLQGPLPNSVSSGLCMLNSNSQLEVQKASLYREPSEIEVSSVSSAALELLLSYNPITDKEIVFVSKSFNSLCLPISESEQIQVIQGLRYHVLSALGIVMLECELDQVLRYHDLVSLIFGASVIGRSRVILGPKLGGCDERIRIRECSYNLKNFSSGVHVNFHSWITSQISITVVVQKLFLLSTTSPLDGSSLESSNQISSYRDRERSYQPSSYLEMRIIPPSFLWLRVSFPLVSKPKKILNFRAVLLSYAMVFSRPEEATVITLVITEVMDQYSKSHCMLTPFKLVEEAVEGLVSFKCLTALNCFNILLTLYQVMFNLPIFCFITLGHFLTSLVAHLDMSDVAFSFVIV